jgi:cytochrome d ubiquinol oxidase subunit II
MSDSTLQFLAAAVALAALMAYSVLAGADFGGGVWDLLAFGPRRQAQRDAVAQAMGPVWEANHVWMIFLLVVLFTCFPNGYAALSVALFVPFHLALVGIILRGSSFVFRAYASYGREEMEKTPHWLAHPRAWGTVFGAVSVLTPLLLGACFGAMTAGNAHLDASGTGSVVPLYPVAWLSPYCIGCGCLALSAFAYLAAVYLVAECTGRLREDFRRRAIFAGTTTAALAAIVLALARRQAPWFFAQLMSARSLPIMFLGMVAFIASALAVFRRRYRWSRIFAAGEIVLLLLGWGVAQMPYMVYPDITLAKAAAPAATLRFLLASLPFGMALLLPSGYLLFRVFKNIAPHR